MDKTNVSTKKRKRIVLFSLLSCVCMCCGINAYLTDMAQKTNNFSVGSQSTELVEPIYEMRGSVLCKEPMVINTGNVPCLVRIKVQIDPEEICASDISIEPTDAKKKSLLDAGYKFWLSWQDEWELADDGYWYYKGVLDVDSETSPIFKTVNWLSLDADGNWLDYQDFDIYVSKESVFVEATDNDGVRYSALNENGIYELEKAMKVWSIYTE